METGSNLIMQLDKSRKILLNLLARQGFNIAEYANFSITEVDSMYQHQQLDMLLERTDEESGKNFKMYVRYYLKALRPANINDIIDDLFVADEVLTEKDTLMIITINNANDTISQILKHIYEKDRKFVIVQNIKTLLYNILDNILVPPHRILGDAEVAEVRLKYNITDDSQFQDISRFDPVSQIIGIRPGQVCKIIRPSKTAIDGVCYRICLNI